MRTKLFVGEAVRSIGANISTTVAATMTVLIGMFLLGLFIALFSWVNSWTDHVREDVIVKVFFEQEAVEKVDYAQKKTERILQVTNVIKYIFLLGSVILLIASTILIANTIRLSIFSRRREIEVMKLVGASHWFIRGPFMLEGLLVGLLGSLLAVILLFLSKEVALPSIIPRLDSGPGVQAISFWANALILLGLGLLLGAAGSGLTLRRFLRV